MMKKTARFSFAVIAVLMLLFLAACSPTASTGPQGTSGSASTSEATAVSPTSSSDGIMTPEGKYPETITISIGKASSPSPNLPQGDTVSDNAFTRMLLDRLNIKVNIAWEAEPSEYTNKLSLELASDDLPDAFTLTSATDYLLYKQLVNNDMLADLTDAYAKCAGQYMHSTFDSYQNKNLEPFTENGRLMGIADGAYGYEDNLLWVRSDWMKQYNLQAPKTMDDVKNIIKTFIDNNAGGKGNIGLVLDPQTPASNNYFAATSIFAAYGAYPKIWLKDASGNIAWGSVEPEMKAGLQLLADWYKDGLIDKQFASRTDADSLVGLVNDSQCGIFFAPWWITYSLFPDFPKNNPDGDLIAYNAPLDSNGKYNIIWPASSNTVILVNKKYAHPEAVVKMLNVEYDAWRGLDADLFKMSQPTRDAGADFSYVCPTGMVNLEYANCIPNVGYLVKNYIDNGKLEGEPNVIVTDFDKTCAIRAKGYVDTKSLDDNGWIQYYGRYVASTIVDAPEVNIVYPAYSYSTQSMAKLWANLDTLENSTMLQIITGEKPVDYFDTFVSQWKAQGGDTITKEVQELVQ